MFSSRSNTNLHRRTRNQSYLLWSLALALFLVYASISLVNHYVFRSFAYDLGWYNKVIYDYSKFNLCDFSLGYWRTELLCPLGDHFEPIILLLGPLRYLFGNFTALLIQLVAIVFGAYGAFCFVEERTGNRWLPFLAMLQFGLIWGNFGAVSFDAHFNVLAAMMLPWFLHHFLAGRLKKSLFFFVVAVMCKENMALWMAAVAFGAALLSWPKRKQMFQGLALALGAGIYFVILIKWVIPYMSGGVGEYVHFKYHVLGENMGEVVKNAISHPGKALRLFWENHSGNPANDGIKGELFKIMAWSGGIALILRPQYLLMLVPVIAQKLWHDQPMKWGLSNHYSIEFVPVISIAVFDLILKVKKPALLTGLGILVTAMTFSATVYWFEFRKPVNYHPDSFQFYAKAHYQQADFDPAPVREALKLIPPDAKVSAQNTLVPHLAMRKYIYLFPRIEDAEYIFLLDCRHVYPASPKEYAAKVEDLKQSGEWEIWEEKGAALILKRRKKEAE